MENTVSRLRPPNTRMRNLRRGGLTGHLLNETARRVSVGPAVKPRGPGWAGCGPCRGSPLSGAGNRQTCPSPPPKAAGLSQRRARGYREGHSSVLSCGQDNGTGALLGTLPRADLGGGAGRTERGEQRAREGHLRDHPRLQPETEKGRGRDRGPGGPVSACCRPLCPSRAWEGSRGRGRLSPPPGGAPPRGRPEDPLGASRPTPPQPLGRAPWAGAPRFRHGVPPPRSPALPCVSAAAAAAVSVRTGISATAQVSARTARGGIWLFGRDGHRRPPLAVGVGPAQPSPAAGGGEVGGEEGRPRGPVPHLVTARRRRPAPIAPEVWERVNAARVLPPARVRVAGIPGTLEPEQEIKPFPTCFLGPTRVWTCQVLLQPRGKHFLAKTLSAVAPPIQPVSRRGHGLWANAVLPERSRLGQTPAVSLRP